MVEILPVTVQRAAPCHCRFQPERISEITVFPLSRSSYIYITGFLADIDYSCIAHNLFLVKQFRPASRYFISCLPYRSVPDCARLFGKIPQAERGSFPRKTRRARPCSNPKGTGRPLQAEIKKRPFNGYSLSLSFSSCGIRCFKSGSFFIRVISSSIIRTTSAFIWE